MIVFFAVIAGAAIGAAWLVRNIPDGYGYKDDDGYYHHGRQDRP